MKRKVISILILALFALGCCLMGYFRAREHFRCVTKKVTDTLVVRDTHVIEKPVLVERTRKETLLVSVHDTIRIKDTLYISLPKETKTYKGEDYCAEVSGYQPSLDRIEIYPKTTTISKTETIVQKSSPWRVSLDIGLDYSRMEAKYISPNIGAEIGYKRFSVNAEAGVDLRMQEMIVHKAVPYWEIGMKYSLFRR